MYLFIIYNEAVNRKKEKIVKEAKKKNNKRKKLIKSQRREEGISRIGWLAVSNTAEFK